MSTSTKVSRAYPWSRREFTSASILALLSTVPIAISGCGGSDASPMAPTGSSSVTGTVGANHGHVAVVTAAQLMSDVDIPLSIVARKFY